MTETETETVDGDEAGDGDSGQKWRRWTQMEPVTETVDENGASSRAGDCGPVEEDGASDGDEDCGQKWSRLRIRRL